MTLHNYIEPVMAILKRYERDTHIVSLDYRMVSIKDELVEYSNSVMQSRWIGILRLRTALTCDLSESLIDDKLYIMSIQVLL